MHVRVAGLWLAIAATWVFLVPACGEASGAGESVDDLVQAVVREGRERAGKPPTAGLTEAVRRLGNCKPPEIIGAVMRVPNGFLVADYIADCGEAAAPVLFALVCNTNEAGYAYAAACAIGRHKHPRALELLSKAFEVNSVARDRIASACAVYRVLDGNLLMAICRDDDPVVCNPGFVAIQQNADEWRALAPFLLQEHRRRRTFHGGLVGAMGAVGGPEMGKALNDLLDKVDEKGIDMLTLLRAIGDCGPDARVAEPRLLGIIQRRQTSYNADAATRALALTLIKTPSRLVALSRSEDQNIRAAAQRALAIVRGDPGTEEDADPSWMQNPSIRRRHSESSWGRPL